MYSKTFFNSLANDKIDLVQLLLDLLAETGTDYCLIGGLAVNAYAEPVVSLDLDLVVSADNIDRLCELAKAKGLEVEKFPLNVNFRSPKSDLRIQLQTDARYQDFIPRCSEREIFGYRMKVAAAEDVLQGKIWAYQDHARWKSKRQKDLADIMRLVESNQGLMEIIPINIKEELEK